MFFPMTKKKPIKRIQSESKRKWQQYSWSLFTKGCVSLSFNIECHKSQYLDIYMFYIHSHVNIS